MLTYYVYQYTVLPTMYVLESSVVTQYVQALRIREYYYLLVLGVGFVTRNNVYS